jgi:hypothetical protein
MNQVLINKVLAHFELPNGIGNTMLCYVITILTQQQQQQLAAHIDLL